MSTDLSTAGKRIQFFRKAKGLSQVQLSKLVFVSQPALSYWERDMRNPSPQSWDLLASVLGASVEFLRDGNAAVNRKAAA